MFIVTTMYTKVKVVVISGSVFRACPFPNYYNQKAKPVLIAQTIDKYVYMSHGIFLTKMGSVHSFYNLVITDPDMCIVPVTSLIYI
jgi:hypothetical protein